MAPSNLTVMASISCHSIIIYDHTCSYSCVYIIITSPYIGLSWYSVHCHGAMWPSLDHLPEPLRESVALRRRMSDKLWGFYRLMGDISVTSVIRFYKLVIVGLKCATPVNTIYIYNHLRTITIVIYVFFFPPSTRVKLVGFATLPS